MAHIVYSSSRLPVIEGPINHDARMVPSPQYMNSSEGSVVRIDVLTPSEREDKVIGKKMKAKMMHTAYWLDPDEAIALADALKSAATLVKYHDEADSLLFENIRLRRFLNGE